MRVPAATGGAVYATSEAAAGVLSEVAAEAGQRAQRAAAAAAESVQSGRFQSTLRSYSQRLEGRLSELPEGFWAKCLVLWELPPVKRLRLTVSVANLSIKLPALLVLIATQANLLASQVTLPMLAPLLLGSGMALRSVRANASVVFPRLGVLVVLLWLLWFANSVVRNTTSYLTRQGAIDERLAAFIVTCCELAGLAAAGVVLLSMLGVNVTALLLPAGVALALACKDAARNFMAGIFLFAVQPFALGDRLAVSTGGPMAGLAPPGAAGGRSDNAAGWFEGTCESIDLRYTVLRNGGRRLMVPNTSFINSAFFVLEETRTASTARTRAAGADDAGSSGGVAQDASQAHDGGRRAVAEAAGQGQELVSRAGHLDHTATPVSPQWHAVEQPYQPNGS